MVGVAQPFETAFKANLKTLERSGKSAAYFEFISCSWPRSRYITSVGTKVRESR